jgi:hypothetical protein
MFSMSTTDGCVVEVKERLWKAARCWLVLQKWGLVYERRACLMVSMLRVRTEKFEHVVYAGY